MSGLTIDYIATVTDDFFAKCRIHARIGVPMKDVVDGVRQVPDGYVLDPSTYYYIPDNVIVLPRKQG